MFFMSHIKLVIKVIWIRAYCVVYRPPVYDNYWNSDMALAVLFTDTRLIIHRLTFQSYGSDFQFFYRTVITLSKYKAFIGLGASVCQGVLTFFRR